MSEPTKSVFEARYEGVPPITGEISASIWEVSDGNEVSSDHIIRLGNDWIVRVNWYIEGALASCICGNWSLHLFMESIGDGPEFQYPDPKIEGYRDVHLDLDPCKPLEDNKYWYRQDLRVPNHYIKPEHCSTPYKPVVALTYRDVCKRLGPMAGFVELPTVQFVDPTGTVVEGKFGDPTHPDESREPQTTELDSQTVEDKTTGRQVDESTEIVLTDSFTDATLTPNYLAGRLVPLLVAIEQLQHIIDEIEDRPASEVRIKSINSYSPVSIDLTGGIHDTVELILDVVVKWRRENKKRLAELTVTEKAVEVKQMEAEYERTKARVQSATDKAIAEAELKRAEAREKQLANQKTELEIMSLTIEMFDRIAPGATEEQRLLYINRMFPATRQLARSPLEISSVTPITRNLPEEE